MKLKKSYITLNIPFIKILRTSHNTIDDLPFVKNVKHGRVIISPLFDIGMVGETDRYPYGKPTVVYSRFVNKWSKYDLRDYSKWRDTGIDVSIFEWKRISQGVKNHREFQEYWERRLKSK